MNLIGRPFLGHDSAASHRTGSAAVSITLHGTVLLAVLALLRTEPEKAVSHTVAALVPKSIVWTPHANAGGGRFGELDPAIAPPRRVRAAGHDATSVPSQPEASTETITNNGPEEIQSIPTRPMGDAFTALPGAIDGQSASDALGHGNPLSVGTADKPGPGFGPGVARAGGPGVTTPAVIEQVKPRYTADAMRMRIQGIVLIECVVLPDGSVADARVARSLDAKFGLDEEAIAAAKKWRFRPGMLNGKPVPVMVSIELMFSVR